MRNSPTVGVYWGRFNPPHKGHLRVIRRLRKDGPLVVAIGSSERENERADPFSGAERKAMMEAYLRETGIRDVRVVTVKDGRSESWAVDNLVRKCHPDRLYLSTERNTLADLAQERVHVVRFPRTGSVSSTRIRDAIASGRESWKRLTGKSVARMIEELDGVRRIQVAYGRSPRRTRGSAPGRR